MWGWCACGVESCGTSSCCCCCCCCCYLEKRSIRRRQPLGNANLPRTPDRHYPEHCPHLPRGPNEQKTSISIEIFNLDRNFWSRSKILISMSRFPHKNRAAVGGSLENFILDRNFQSRSKSRIFLIFGPSGFSSWTWWPDWTTPPSRDRCSNTPVAQCFLRYGRLSQLRPHFFPCKDGLLQSKDRPNKGGIAEETCLWSLSHYRWRRTK